MLAPGLSYSIELSFGEVENDSVDARMLSKPHRYRLLPSQSWQ